MSELILSSAERYNERGIADSVKDLHGQFLELVPRYGKQKWDPRLALKTGAGSCMAELLYVAGGLLANEVVEERDITVGFSKSHGEEQPIGFVGKSGKKYAHTFMMITVGNGVTLEMDFRANRADEEPRIQRLLPGELDMDVLYLGELASAITEYAKIEGVDGPTVKELIGMHNNSDPDSQIPNHMLENIVDITFDEDF